MKNLLAIIILLSCTLAANAQNSPPVRGSSYQDSVRAQSSGGKVNIVNGTPMNSAMDFVENLTQSKSHTQFLAAIRSASMVGTLKSRGPLTVFAPTDSAFKNRLGKRLDTLTKPDHKYELVHILTYHIIAGRFDAKELAKQIKDGNGEATFTTLSGSKLTARIDANRNIVLYDEKGGQSIISRFNIEQSNGLLHLVTQVLIPKEKAL